MKVSQAYIIPANIAGLCRRLGNGDDMYRYQDEYRYEVRMNNSDTWFISETIYSDLLEILACKKLNELSEMEQSEAMSSLGLQRLYTPVLIPTLN